MRPVRQLISGLRLTLQKRGASADEAEDLVQEAFLKFEAYRQVGEVREPEGFVVRTALNLAVDAGRRKKRSPFSSRALEEFAFADSAPGPDEVLQGRDRLRRLREGLEALKPRTRDMLLAQRLEGLSYAQIAAREGISVSAVEKQIARAVLFLMDWMEGW
ncbi:MAG: RNA polymerase sigma factor [Ignavibacteriales bacterium]